LSLRRSDKEQNNELFAPTYRGYFCIRSWGRITASHSIAHAETKNAGGHCAICAQGSLNNQTPLAISVVFDLAMTLSLVKMNGLTWTALQCSDENWSTLSACRGITKGRKAFELYLRRVNPRILLKNTLCPHLFIPRGIIIPQEFILLSLVTNPLKTALPPNTLEFHCSVS